MSEREKYPELIVRYNLGEMTPEEAGHFRELISQDPRLASEVLLDVELNRMFKKMEVIDFVEKLRKTIGSDNNS